MLLEHWEIIASINSIFEDIDVPRPSGVFEGEAQRRRGGRCHKCGATAVTSTFDGVLRCAECIDVANNPDWMQSWKVGQTDLNNFV